MAVTITKECVILYYRKTLLFIYLNFLVEVIITAQILLNSFNSNELSLLDGRLKISFPLGKSSSPLTHARVQAAIKVHLILVSSGWLTLQRYLC